MTIWGHLHFCDFFLETMDKFKSDFRPGLKLEILLCETDFLVYGNIRKFDEN